MKQTSELLETGLYHQDLIVNKKKDITIKEYKASLSLGVECGVLVNNIRVNEDYILKEGDSVVLIPHLRGG